MDSATRNNMLAVLLKPPLDGDLKQDKVSVVLKVGFKYLKLCTKMFSTHKIEEGKLILDFMQRSVNQIYLSEESYLWSLLKIRLVITRLHYLESTSKSSESKENECKKGEKVFFDWLRNKKTTKKVGSPEARSKNIKNLVLNPGSIYFASKSSEVHTASR